MSAAQNPPQKASRRQDPETPPADPPRVPPLATAADLLAVGLVLVGVTMFLTGGTTFWIGDLRVSLRSPTRPYVLALAVIILRHWLAPQPAAFLYLRGFARDPLPMDEQHLFGGPSVRGWLQRTGRFVMLVFGFSVLVAAMTWPQVRHLDWVPDVGDPLFSIWRISWVNHQIWRDPLNLFEANIFHPERLTLTYSDPVLLPALIVAPFFWLGVHKVLIYNVLFLSGFVLSGVTMFMLVRALTARRDAALVSGAIFALYPYRFEHYSHLELQMTMWMPLALWGVHRTMAEGRLRDGLLTGLAFALQMLSSLYYGVFLSAYLTVVGGALWFGRGRPRRPLRALAAGGLLAGVLIAPVASRYLANKPMIGDRDVGTIRSYSAEGPDYLKAHFRSWTYSSLSEQGHPERQLFPRIAPVVLAAVALWPPLSTARIAYALGLVLAVDGSLGLNGQVYGWLHAYVPPFRGLRVPARFSLLAGLSLAILSGYGAARICRRWPRQRAPLVAAMVALVIVEAIPNMPLEPVPRQPPAIYAALAGAPEAVLAEFPMPVKDLDLTFETHYLYFSTFQWHKLVNGDSGFFPPSYYELLEREQDFPSDAAIGYLKSRGVQYLTVHGAFYKGNPDRLLNTLAALDSRADMELVSAARWGGGESRLYRLR